MKAIVERQEIAMQAMKRSIEALNKMFEDVELHSKEISTVMQEFDSNLRPSLLPRGS